MKRLLLVQAMLGALLLTTPVFAAHQSGSPSKWENMQVGITYRLYKPGTTLGYKLNRFQAASCGKGHEPWAAATYGTYNGTLGSNKKGFALYEGHPICSDPAESTKIGLLRIMGVYAYVGVYCDPQRALHGGGRPQARLHGPVEGQAVQSLQEEHADAAGHVQADVQAADQDREGPEEGLGGVGPVQHGGDAAEAGAGVDAQGCLVAR